MRWEAWKQAQSRSCGQSLKNMANVNRSQATARCCCPRIHHLFESHYITSVENNWFNVVLLILQVFILQTFVALQLYLCTTFMQVGCVHEQLRNWTSKNKSPKGKSKFPMVPFFCIIFFLYNGEIFFKAIQDLLHFKEKKVKVHTTCTRCAFRLYSQVSISSLHSPSPEDGRPAVCIMPELFHATGSLNFHIHPHSFVEKGHSADLSLWTNPQRRRRESVHPTAPLCPSPCCFLL